MSPENSSVEALTLSIIELIGIRGWSLWGIITFIEGHEHRAPMKNECPDKKKCPDEKEETRSHSLSTCEDTVRRRQSASQEGGSHHEPNCPAP